MGHASGQTGHTRSTTRAQRRRGRRFAAHLTLVAVFGAATLSACGGGDSGEPVGTESNALKLYNDKGAWTQYFKQTVALVKKDIDVTVDPVGYTDQANYVAFIKPAFRTDKRPDLFTWYTGAQLGDLVKNKLVADSSAIWAKGIQDGDLAEGLKPYYTVDGKQYCVPLNVSYWAMFYNKKIFEKFGLQPPTTWTELLDIAAELKSRGVTAFYNTSVLFSFVWFEQILASSDPELYDRLSTGDAKYTDPGVVKTMQTWKQLIDTGYMTDPASKEDYAAVLKSGKAAMAPWGTWFNTQMKSAGMKAGSDYGVFVIPNVNASLPKTTLIFETGPLCASARARSLETSDKFMSWWIKPEAQDTWSNSRGDVSGNPKVAIADPALDKLSKDAGAGKYELVNRYFEATPPPILKVALDEFGAFETNPDDYMKALETIQKAADEYWSQQSR